MAVILMFLFPHLLLPLPEESLPPGDIPPCPSTPVTQFHFYTPAHYRSEEKKVAAK